MGIAHLPLKNGLLRRLSSRRTLPPMNLRIIIAQSLIPLCKAHPLA